MSVTITTFRTDIPAFSNISDYPDSSIQFWLDIATTIPLFNRCKWGPPAPDGQPKSLFDFGVEQFIAHNLVLEKMANDRAAVGGPPGIDSGALASNSVDKASVAYDNASTSYADAGFWNQTIYGKRYWYLTNLVGVGGLQIGVGYLPVGAGPFGPTTGQAWPGPFVIPTPESPF